MEPRLIDAEIRDGVRRFALGGDPSMEPRLIDAEILVGKNDRNGVARWTFNGAASHRRGDLSRSGLVHRKLCAFNGAASHRRGDLGQLALDVSVFRAFNGAASHRRGDRLLHHVVRVGDLPSMEPRLIDAEILRSRASNCAGIALQWSRVSSTRRSVVHLLERWRHRGPFNGAASHRRGDLALVALPAQSDVAEPSMEPRLIDAEITSRFLRSVTSAASFNGAASHRRGDLPKEELDPFLDALLQWSRVSSTRRSSSSEKTFAPCSLPSMEPRLIDAEILAPLASMVGWFPLQWSRVSSTRRSCSRRGILGTRASAFNGAASHRRGDPISVLVLLARSKTLQWSRVSSTRRSLLEMRRRRRASVPFNGAASHRRGDRASMGSRDANAFPDRLQWSRVSSTRRSWQHENADPRARAFNGAASHRRGDPLRRKEVAP